MVCRILAIPLAVVVAIAVFLCPVLGTSLPDNVVSTQFLYRLQIVGGAYQAWNLNSGVIYGRAAYHSANGTYTGNIIETTPGNYDVYIPVYTPSLGLGYIDFGTLAPYYKKSGNLVVSNTSDVPFYDFSGVTLTTAYTLTKTYSVTFLYFQDVPSGLAFTLKDNNPGKMNSGSANIEGTNSNTFPFFVFGVFYSNVKPSGDSIVSGFEEGSISFPDAITGIQNIVKENVNNAETPDQAILETLVGQQQIDQIINISDNQSISNIRDTVQPNLDNQIDSFVSGSQSLDQTIENMKSEYSSALSSSDTPIQGILVNTSYQISLMMLEAQARQKAYQKLDSAISDDQLTEADDYYQSEEELIDMFEVAEFESALDFQLWFNTLPPSETTQYKKFFDYLLNDSSIRMFLVVPISLILVRILLGTHLVLSRGGDHSSRSSVLDRDSFFFGNDPYTGD